MIRNGPLPLLVHSAIEYVAALLLIVAPFLIGFTDTGAATAVSIVAGVLVLVIAASTDWTLSLTRAIALPAHALLDFTLAGLLIASPFIFGFSDRSNPTAFFIALGVAHLLLTLATRFGPRADRAARRGREREPEPDLEPAATPATEPPLGPPE